jgi:hypothetical protein
MPDQNKLHARDGANVSPYMRPLRHVPGLVRALGIAGVATIGLYVLARAFHLEREFTFSGLNDFPALYLGPGRT